MARYVLAIDLGTSALKVALVAMTGEVVAAEEESHRCELLPGGGAEQDPEGWWEGLDQKRRQRLRQCIGTIIEGEGWVDRHRLTPKASSNDRSPYRS